MNKNSEHVESNQAKKENQRMSMRNLCLEVLWLDHNNTYKQRERERSRVEVESNRVEVERWRKEQQSGGREAWRKEQQRRGREQS